MKYNKVKGEMLYMYNWILVGKVVSLARFSRYRWGKLWGYEWVVVGEMVSLTKYSRYKEEWLVMK